MTRPPRINKLVFEEDVWHPLDHLIGSPRCLSFQNSKRRCIERHLEYYWDFKWYSNPIIHRALQIKCWFGFHRWMDYWVRENPNLEWSERRTSCRDCAARKESSENP